MTVVEASSDQGPDDPRASWQVLEHEPENGEQNAPSEGREGDDRQQSVSAPNGDLGQLGTSLVWGLAVCQLAWVGALVYLALRLLT